MCGSCFNQFMTSVKSCRSLHHSRTHTKLVGSRKSRNHFKHKREKSLLCWPGTDVHWAIPRPEVRVCTVKQSHCRALRSQRARARYLDFCLNKFETGMEHNLRVKKKLEQRTRSKVERDFAEFEDRYKKHNCRILEYMKKNISPPVMSDELDTTLSQLLYED
ncbi:hypothetical protein M8J76_012969 [Diaphorina citri]|nr:hypothetical protein M8J75_008520 [Diaphorina citri]KAI5719651.1 hypothetical protein M8J76_012969 [Diaphorina citri]KAI5720978.1 hypothetical protein M8J77_014148 [Diaphorina citri]